MGDGEKKWKKWREEKGSGESSGREREGRLGRLIREGEEISWIGGKREVRERKRR
jgi:hypothetical protein